MLTKKLPHSKGPARGLGINTPVRLGLMVKDSSVSARGMVFGLGTGVSSAERPTPQLCEGLSISGWRRDDERLDYRRNARLAWWLSTVRE